MRQHDGRDRDLVQGHGCAEKGGEGKGGGSLFLEKEKRSIKKGIEL